MDGCIDRFAGMGLGHSGRRSNCSIGQAQFTAVQHIDVECAFGGANGAALDGDTGVGCIRILVAGLLFNGAFGAVYSLAGGVLSFLVMWGLKKTNLFSMAGVSMAGGVAHNMGQLLVASAIVSNLKMFLYFPVLMFSGLASGIMIGIVACVIDSRVPKQLFR